MIINGKIKYFETIGRKMFDKYSYHKVKIKPIFFEKILELESKDYELELIIDDGTFKKLKEEIIKTRKVRMKLI